MWFHTSVRIQDRDAKPILIVRGLLGVKDQHYEVSPLAPEIVAEEIRRALFSGSGFVQC